MTTKSLPLLLLLLFAGLSLQAQQRMNVIFILADDHRYDAMGFYNKYDGLKTPNMDRMAREGVHFSNAFVSTSLCSPSRASILTGQYAHAHKVVDNQAPLPEGLTFFPQHLQKQGYRTAFIGKWHMGHSDDAPQKGFDYWLSFRGQGTYYNTTLNENGKRFRIEDSSHISDVLTDKAIGFLKETGKSKPFFLYLSHKAVHAEFAPAKRHKGQQQNMKLYNPPSMYLTVKDTLEKYKNVVTPTINYRDIPNWVIRQRDSWHGVDYMYHGQIKFNDFMRSYLETVSSVDESIGRVISYLEENGLAQNTVVFYMGDNGFSFGEHGLIDKRHAYEESMRVPLLVYAPGMGTKGRKVEQLVQGIDIAPTILNIAGVNDPGNMHGKSMLPFLKGQNVTGWRDKIFYEYYWEYDFPQTPTIFSVRTDRFKYIFNHGTWDINELYDLKSDPHEMKNLIRDSSYRMIARDLRTDMFKWLKETGGQQIPLQPLMQPRSDHIYRGVF